MHQNGWLSNTFLVATEPQTNWVALLHFTAKLHKQKPSLSNIIIDFILFFIYIKEVQWVENERILSKGKAASESISDHFRSA